VVLCLLLLLLCLLCLVLCLPCLVLPCLHLQSSCQGQPVQDSGSSQAWPYFCYCPGRPQCGVQGGRQQGRGGRQQAVTRLGGT
jgi:hypothetical protein